MAREKKIIIGALNVTIQPHSPEKYLELFRDVHKLKKPVQIHGDQYGLLSGTIRLSDNQDEPGPIYGDIFKFTNIDTDADWFDLLTSGFADETAIKKVQIPENLKPNSTRFSYIFYPQQHLFFYEGYYDGNNLGANVTEKFLGRLLNQVPITKKYGKVEVTHVPEKDALEDAFKMKIKQRIELVMKVPNPDVNAEAERRVMERMKTLKVAEVRETYKASESGSIEIDAELKTRAQISAKNGSVYIKGKDESFHPKEFSTERHPWREAYYYEPKVEQPFQVLARIADQMRATILEWFK